MLIKNLVSIILKRFLIKYFCIVTRVTKRIKLTELIDTERIYNTKKMFKRYHEVFTRRSSCFPHHSFVSTNTYKKLLTHFLGETIDTLIKSKVLSDHFNITSNAVGNV